MTATDFDLGQARLDLVLGILDFFDVAPLYLTYFLVDVESVEEETFGLLAELLLGLLQDLELMRHVSLEVHLLQAQG